MPAWLQNTVNVMRRFIPRGWTLALSSAAHFIPSLQCYRAKLLNGDHIFLDLREKMCFGIFFDGELPHEIGTEKLISKFVNKGDVFVDVGANVGYFTRIASHIVGDEGLVLAFEPSTRAVKILEMNCADLPNVKVFATALSDHAGELQFYLKKFGDTSSFDPEPRSQMIRVPVNTLDNMLSQYDRVDFIKIDVEGFEPEVIRGALQIIQKHRPIIYFEFLEQYAVRHGFNYGTFQGLFAGLNYELRWVDHKGTALFSQTPSSYITASPVASNSQ